MRANFRVRTLGPFPGVSTQFWRPRRRARKARERGESVASVSECNAVSVDAEGAENASELPGQDTRSFSRSFDAIHPPAFLTEVG